MSSKEKEKEEDGLYHSSSTMILQQGSVTRHGE